jgi:L-ascorbate metabolism protein UlaG (beta-lactamase superfamily)
MLSLVGHAGRALFAAVIAGNPFLAGPADAPAIRVRWLGHAAFEIVSPGGTRLLIDPWLREHPSTPATYKDTSYWSSPERRPSAILVTHPHSDHDADVALLSRVSGAKVVATGDHLELLRIPEGQYLSINIGGVQRVGDLAIHAVPAMHSSTPGRALGYVLRFADGRTLYHTGDTWVFGDMALIERFFHPVVILLAMGGDRYFHPRGIVPMHYGTNPQLATEADVRAAFRGDRRLQVLVPGEEKSF